jgi:uncharacterized membrane protein
MSTTATAHGSYAPPTGGTAAPVQRPPRVASIDIVRGVVMVLMAIDHVRVYAGVPAGGPEPGVFFTRWVTHFCAPAFIFLAGTAAFLHGQKLGDRASLSRFLLTRGLWLLVLELTLLRFAWTFNFDYANFTFAGVIWCIGWCMVLMAGLVYLPLRAVGALGVAIIALHNVVNLAMPAILPMLRESSITWLWQILYFGGDFPLWTGGPRLVVLYSIIPWIGVMAAGFAFGAIVRTDEARRRRLCISLGTAMIGLFLVLRAWGGYGDPRPWQAQLERMPAALAFLNTAKYPASLQFLLMTLGPTILVLPFLEHARGRLARWLTVFGRVPFFYYVLHLPLIHAVAVLISLVRTPADTGWLVANHPMFPPPVPDGYAYSLPLLYLVWLGVVVALYVPCRWFADLKQRRKDAWLSYL